MAVACGLGRRSQFGVEYIEDQRVHEVVPPYTSSIDAVVALIEEKLPGWAWKMGTCCVSDDAWLAPDFNHPVHGERLKATLPYEEMKAGSIWDAGVDIDRRPPGNVPLALLEALLQALIEVQK